MYVIIVGGGKVGYYLTQALQRQGHEVLLMEKSGSRAEFLTEELGEVVRHGDGCEVRIMREAGMQRADVVAAVTGDDEDNLVICQMAKRYFHVPRTVARVNNPKNESTLRALGLEEVVNATGIIYNLIEQEVESGEVLPVSAIAGGRVEVVEAEVVDESPVAHKLVKDVDLPGDCMLAAIVRGTQIIQPSMTSELLPGDTIVALAKPEDEHVLREALSRPETGRI
jgi:trk system potassium uptake protein TrkA